MQPYNAEMSFRSFGANNQIHQGISRIVSPTVFSFGISPIPQFSFKLRDNEVQYAMLMMKSGALAGSKSQIASNVGNEITLQNKLDILAIPEIGDEFYIYWDLTKLPASRFNNSSIRRSGFSQSFGLNEVIPESGGKKVFPDGVVGLELYGCNLDNVEIPSGVTVYDDEQSAVTSTNKTTKATNNGDVWVCTKSGQTWVPNAPINIKEYNEWYVSADPADISQTPLSEDRIISRKSKILALLERTNSCILMSGGLVVRDNDLTNELDVRLTSGRILCRDGTRRDIQPSLSRDKPMTRHYFVNGIPTSDTNIEIDPTRVATQNGLVATIAGLYYKSMFVVDMDGNLHWHYPIHGYTTPLEAAQSVLPMVSPNIGMHAKSTALIMKGDDTVFPAIASGRWIDISPKLEKLSDNATSVEEGV